MRGADVLPDSKAYPRPCEEQGEGQAAAVSDEDSRRGGKR